MYSCIIKELRKSRGYTQDYMARMLGYSSKSGYCQLENGDVSMTLDKAVKISQLLDVDVEDIFLRNEFM